MDGEFGDELAIKIARIRADLIDEYLQPHSYPWIVGYSGGKDSTLVCHLVFELLLQLPPSDRRRRVHIVANDTLVESPLVMAHVDAVQHRMQQAASAFGLPVVVAKTTPEIDGTFWVNLIGRGYPSPSRSFRWCTDRMKIQPTSVYIRREASAAGKVILLLGVRRDESAKRSASINRYENGERLNPHNDLSGCLVYRPIVDLATDDVWEYLGSQSPPWAGSHGPLIRLYRDAAGGECPVVTQKSDAPSCGTSSSRFGCWTCTVVVKDKSLEGFIESGFTQFGPLIEFRDWLAEIRNEPTRRMIRRRGGKLTLKRDGELVPGPFTFETRREILGRVLSLQLVMSKQLISTEEVKRIHMIWAEDAALEARSIASLEEVG